MQRIIFLTLLLAQLLNGLSCEDIEGELRKQYKEKGFSSNWIYSTLIAPSLASLSQRFPLITDSRIKIHKIEGIPKGFRPQNYGFFQLGSKYYKIGTIYGDWYEAVHVCHTVGAQLISLNDSAMFEDISAKVKTNYWVDLSDHSNLDNVTSITTGQAPNFVKWCENTKEEPNPEKMPRCVYIEYSESNPCMKRSSCRAFSLSYVCELDNPKAITILVR